MQASIPLVDEEGAFFGVELNKDLTSHKAGRIFLEAHALMETEAQGYQSLKGNSRSQSKKEI